MPELSGNSVAALLREAQARLRESPSPTVDAEILLGAALGRDRTWMRTFPEFVPAAEQVQCFAGWLQRRVQGEPVAYILGQRGFWTLDLDVTPDTLIPRPDTELLVETVLVLPLPADARVLDLGTGSGAIALALASEKPAWQLTAVDQSTRALAIAGGNRDKARLKNVQFIHSDWFSALSGSRYHLIVSNPPYIADDDVHLRQGDLRFEPLSALASGPDGLDDIRRIIASSPAHLGADGWLAFEHGYDQGESCRALLLAGGFVAVQTRRDLGGNERVTLGQWSC